MCIARASVQDLSRHNARAKVVVRQPDGSVDRRASALVEHDVFLGIHPTVPAELVEQTYHNSVQIQCSGQLVDEQTAFLPHLTPETSSERGSGTVIAVDDMRRLIYISTDKHVVALNDRVVVMVTRLDGPASKHKARVLRVECQLDVAVLVLEGEEYDKLSGYLRPAAFCPTMAIAEGTQVYAAGYPLGDANLTITTAPIAKYEDVPALNAGVYSNPKVAEFESPISSCPGNSGGGLFVWDASQKQMLLVGMNNAGIPSANNTCFSLRGSVLLSVLPALMHDPKTTKCSPVLEFPTYPFQFDKLYPANVKQTPHMIRDRVKIDGLEKPYKLFPPILWCAEALSLGQSGGPLVHNP